LPNDENHDSQADRHPQDGGEIPETSLESAIANLRRNDGTSGEEPFGIRRKIAIAERSALIRWCDDHLLSFKEPFWASQVAIGGSEHDIWAENHRMWKITRPDRFGWTVLPGDNGVPEITQATPLEYLLRWKHSNDLFGDRVRFEGIFVGDEGVQVIVSQEFIVGFNPTVHVIVLEMARRGFVLIPGFSIGSEPDSSFYNPVEDIAIFDAACDNFIECSGIPVPIDVIPVKVGSKLRAQLLKLMD